LQLVDMCTFGA